MITIQRQFLFSLLLTFSFSFLQEKEVNISPEIKSTKESNCNVFIPTAFSPDGDGINDEFKPQFDCVLYDYQFVVLIRNWGIIFETKDPNKGWDGQWKGKTIFGRTFLYILHYKESPEGETITRKGFIHIWK
jgi:gliding motility-associated-like protein